MSRVPRRTLCLALLCWTVPLAGQADRVELRTARFATGDDPARKTPDFDDRGWATISTSRNFEPQGFEGYDGWAWYRMHVSLPRTLLDASHWKQRLLLHLPGVDDIDQTWFNGVLVGSTGTGPDDPAGYVSQWQAVRDYPVDLTTVPVHWDGDNVIAIRVYDGGGPGGFYREVPWLRMAEVVDGVALGDSVEWRYQGGLVAAKVRIRNANPADLRGEVSWETWDLAAGRALARLRKPLPLDAGASATVTITAPQRAGMELRLRYTDAASSRWIEDTLTVPYLLTPAPPARPRVNGARIAGVRPGSPFLFRIPATGRPPLRYAASGLPAGLTLDPATGIISGRVATPGDYPVTLEARNSVSRDQQPLLIRVGDTLALTPPMGWNSWNVFGLSVTADRVRETGEILLRSGLADHGWTYVNIDDGWEAAARAADGRIVPNAKFPDMRALGDTLHALGLRFGIYSSPGPRTCGGFLGSYQHEAQDAASYATWGIDYLKYDLCSYLTLMPASPTLAQHQAPYRVMQAALRAQPRDIVYSLCQYGLLDVWTWGTAVGGNAWRTTGDIEDTWESMRGIAERQDAAAPYAGPGHWNDPDMLVVGVVGWGGSPHPSRLTPDEQYSHISLWSLLAAPLLLGNDLRRLDPFTLNLLTNDEVLAVDQDPLGKAARRVWQQDGWEIWSRPLADGRSAVGIFNVGDGYRTLHVDPAVLGARPGAPLRDLWRQHDLGPLDSGFQARVPRHGVLLMAVGRQGGWSAEGGGE